VSVSPLDVAPPVGDRLKIRPEPWIFLLLILAVGGAGAVAGIVGLVLLLHGQLAGLLFIAITAFCLAMLYVVLGGYLWADQERVGNKRLGERGSCRRDELASVTIVPTGLRSGPACVFVRKNGTEAFHTVARVWGDGQLKILAQFLGVPLVHDTHPHLATNICPVCGYRWLGEPAYTKDGGSGQLCPCCGFDFVGPIDPARHAQWRQQWIDGGMTWWAAQAGKPAPDYWDPAGQLKALLG
jgi:hypothetical protein